MHGNGSCNELSQTQECGVINQTTLFVIKTLFVYSMQTQKLLSVREAVLVQSLKLDFVAHMVGTVKRTIPSVKQSIITVDSLVFEFNQDLA